MHQRVVFGFALETKYFFEFIGVVVLVFCALFHFFCFLGVQLPILDVFDYSSVALDGLLRTVCFISVIAPREHVFVMALFQTSCVDFHCRCVSLLVAFCRVHVY